MRIFPAIDVLDGAVVRLFQGDYGQVTRYGRSIGAQLEAWKEAGAAWVHVIDLDGARTGKPDPSLWQRVASRGVAVQLGGGIRSAQDAGDALGSGIDRVIIGTSAVRSPGALASTVEQASPDRVVVAVDVRNGQAGAQGWLDEGRAFQQVVEDALEAGVGRFLVTAIARDGAMSGPDLDLLESVRRQAPDAELMAAGGIATMGDLRRLADSGIDGAVIGRALYEGGIHLTEALAEFPG